MWGVYIYTHHGDCRLVSSSDTYNKALKAIEAIFKAGFLSYPTPEYPSTEMFVPVSEATGIYIQEIIPTPRAPYID